MGHTFPLKRLSCALALLAFCAVSHAQTAFQTCAFSDPTHCYGIGPGNTGQAYMSNGAAAYPSFSSSLPGVTSVNGTTIPANGTLLSIPSLVNGYVLSNNGTSLQWILNAGTPGGSNLQLQYNNSGAFGGIALGTSGQALISNGSSSAPSFSASLSGVTSVNGSTISASAGTIPGSTGSFTANDCLKVGSTSPLEIADTGAACGSGGSTAFSAITGGTNTSAAMVVGTGASLNFSASGTINASTLNGATFASPGTIGGGTPGAATFTTITAATSANIPVLQGLVSFTGIPSASNAVTTWLATPYSSGTGTTNVPLIYANSGGSTPTTWSTAGTYFGVNGAGSFAGNFLDFHLNGGASVASLSYTGSLTVSNVIDSALTAGTSPVCPNGSGGALTTTGCSGGGGSGTVNTGSAGQLGYYAATGTAIFPLTTPLPLIGYATASLPTCNSAAKGEIAYTTDGTPAFTFCNGTTWSSNGGTTFTASGTGCTISSITGDATGGSFVLGSGPCTSVTIAFNGSVGMTAPHLWVCSISDQTLQGGVSTPTQGTPTTATTGGSLPASTTYYFVVTATNSYGQTTISSVQSIATGSGTATNTVTPSWTAVVGATGYTIWISTSTITAGESSVAYTTAASTATSVAIGSVPGTTGTTPSSNTTVAWFGEWGQSASTTSGATVPIPPAAGPDLITFTCDPH